MLRREAARVPSSPKIFANPQKDLAPTRSTLKWPEGAMAFWKLKCDWGCYAFLSFGVFSCGASLPRPAPWRSEHAETKWSRTEARNGGDAKPETLRKEVVEEINVRATPSKKPLILLDGSPRRFQLELNSNIVAIFSSDSFHRHKPLTPLVCHLYGAPAALPVR